MGAFDNNVALVTGAGAGIGRATALRLAAGGAAVAIADIDEEAANAVAGEARALGTEAIAIGGNLADGPSVTHLVAKTISEFGRLDILDNNGAAVGVDGTGRDRGVLDITRELWDLTFDVNLWAPVLTCQAAIPQMLQQGKGAILNIISIHALAGDTRFTAYGAAKAGLIALTRAVATQFGKQNIRANALAPGATLTDSFQREVDQAGRARRVQHCITPALGTPDQIAAVAAFLLSDDAAYVTGQLLCVDGGTLAHMPGVDWASNREHQAQ